MGDASVTLSTLTLGSIDSVTGWYAKSYADTTIDMVILPRGASFRELPVGYYARYEHTGFTASTVTTDDEITDAASTKYKVLDVQSWYWLDAFSHYTCNLVKLSVPVVRPTTSGTGASVEDARHRTKDFLDTYLVAANITKDNGSTEASFITQFAWPDYSLSRIFNGKGVDLIYSIDVPTTRVDRVGYNGLVKSYLEQVPVAISCIDKTGITGNTLLWKAERELRDAVEDHAPSRTTTWVGSFRGMSRVRSRLEEMGGWTLYTNEYVLNYMRDLT